MALFLEVKSCACEIERQITMVRVSVWAGVMQIPRSSMHVHWLPFFRSPMKLGLFGADKTGRFLGWVLASAEGPAESCNLNESDKFFMLVKLAKGLLHPSAGFLKS